MKTNTPTRPEPLQFPARGKRFVTDAATGRIWTSRCGRYRVRESHVGAVVRFYAQHEIDGVWTVLQIHRKRGAALRTCQLHARTARKPR